MTEIRHVVEAAMAAHLTTHALLDDSVYRRSVGRFWELEHSITDQIAAGKVLDLSSTILELAEVFAVVEDLRDLIDAGADQMPDQMTLKPSDLVSPAGFVWFENGEGPTVPDSKGQPMVISALAYAAVSAASIGEELRIQFGTDVPDTIIVIPYSNMLSPRDMSSAGVSGLLEKIELTGSSLLREMPRVLSMPLALIPFNVPVSEAFDRDAAAGDYTQRGARLLFAVLKFLGEKWVDQRRVQGSRAARRRSARKLPSGDEVVSRIVRLRRATEGGDPTHEALGHREYTCRWFVRGHWREYTPGEFCWVRPHVKGPDGKPLRAVDRVYGVVR